MTKITAHELFRAPELPADAVLSGDELVSAFWQLKKMQRESQQQQSFWKSVNDSLSDAYKKLASFQEELKTSREQLREANEQLERKVQERTAALAEARELSESIVSSISDVLLVVDRQGVVTRANREAAELLGEEESALEGRAIDSILLPAPDGDAALPVDWLDIVLREGELHNREVILASAVRDPIPVVVSAARIESPRKEVQGVVCIAKDMREQRRVEAELRDKLAQIEEQQQTIRALFTPVIQVWSKILVLPIVGSVDAARATEMMDALLQAVVDTQSEFVILDLTGVKGVDAETADHLLKMHRAANLLGTRCLLSGLSPDISRMLITLDIDLRDLVSFGKLQAALQHALGLMGELSGGRGRAH
ncbi:STAS domain-containing protein [Polyangium aurulentum]|uniref:STAS domain-containing protein n=1 Tax=Polyangium aurulentum TaxID=2567896 RepID=UPI0010AE2F3B|nr:STAS domain-containing protein [Polyangium aurulentum]UQA62918.1 PAS domain-containing protein [Polyangium aurulentum]